MELLCCMLKQRPLGQFGKKLNMNMNHQPKTTHSFELADKQVRWKYATAPKAGGNTFRTSMVSLGLSLICLFAGIFGIEWDRIRGTLLLVLSGISMLVAIITLWLYWRQLKIAWTIEFGKNSLILTHQLPGGERRLEIPYQEIQKIERRSFHGNTKCLN